MQREIERRKRLLCRSALGVQGGNSGDRLSRRIERSAADVGLRRAADAEGREKTVTQELQNLAATLYDGPGHAVEVVVEHAHKFSTRHGIGELGEATQVGVEQHRLDA